MTHEEINQLMMDNATFLVSQNAEQIAELISKIDFSKSPYEISAQLACAVTTISVSMATGLTFRLLESYGIVDLENAVRSTPKSNFKVISGGLEKPSKA